MKEQVHNIKEYINIRVEYERIERYEYELKYNMKECLSDY